MTNSIADIVEQANAYLIIGSNTTEQHPVMGIQLRQAVKRRGAQIVLADPRRLDLADIAAIHLQHKPGTDIALINGQDEWIPPERAEILHESDDSQYAAPPAGGEIIGDEQDIPAVRA